jgi:hypothetical protein
MLSEKVRRLHTFLDLAANGKVMPNRTAFQVAARMAGDLSEQVKALEQAQIPRRQRLHDDHLASGKVVMMPIIPKNEAVWP